MNGAVVPPKPKRKSRTMWLNGVVSVTAIIFIAGDLLDLARATGISVPEDVAKYVLFAVGLANIYLRRKTTQPVR